MYVVNRASTHYNKAACKMQLHKFSIGVELQQGYAYDQNNMECYSHIFHSKYFLIHRSGIAFCFCHTFHKSNIYFLNIVTEYVKLSTSLQHKYIVILKFCSKKDAGDTMYSSC